MKRRAELNLTINGVTYRGAGDSIAQAAAELEQQVAAAGAADGARWRPTPKGWAWAYRELRHQREAERADR